MSFEGTGPVDGPRAGVPADWDGLAPPDGPGPEQEWLGEPARESDGVTPDGEVDGGHFEQSPRSHEAQQPQPVQEPTQQLQQPTQHMQQPTQQVQQPTQQLQQPTQYFASPSGPSQPPQSQQPPLQAQPHQYPQQHHQMPMSQQLPPPQAPQYPYQGQHQYPQQHYPQTHPQHAQQPQQPQQPAYPPQYQQHQQYQGQHSQYPQAQQYQQQQQQPPAAYPYDFNAPYNGAPNWQWPPAPALPPRPKVRARVKAGAAIILVLALAAGAGGVAIAKAGTGGAAASRTTGQAARQQQIASLWRSASADDLLPLSLSREGTETYQRIGVDPDEQCSTLPAPMLAALHPAGCVRVIQATYVDRTQTVTATVGIVVLSGSATVRQSLFQDWTPDANASNTLMMPHTYPVPGTDAANFQDAQRVAWESEVTNDGSYLLYAVAGFSDGRPGPSAADRSAGSGSALDSDSPPVEVAGDLPTAISQILVAQETTALGTSGS